MSRAFFLFRALEAVGLIMFGALVLAISWLEKISSFVTSLVEKPLRTDFDLKLITEGTCFELTLDLKSDGLCWLSNFKGLFWESKQNSSKLILF